MITKTIQTGRARDGSRGLSQLPQSVQPGVIPAEQLAQEAAYCLDIELPGCSHRFQAPDAGVHLTLNRLVADAPVPPAPIALTSRV